MVLDRAEFCLKYLNISNVGNQLFQNFLKWRSKELIVKNGGIEVYMEILTAGRTPIFNLSRGGGTWT